MTVCASNFLSLCMVTCLTFSLVACKPKSQSELYGTYVADYDIARERLTLDKDGTFVQEVTLKATSKVDLSNGRWTYDPTRGYVTFEENFMNVLDGFRRLNPDYAHPKRGSVVEPVDKYLGRILIGAAEGILYKKVN